MTALIGPRLQALLSDLGVPTPEEPEPAPRVGAPPQAVPPPGSPLRVVLTVSDVNRAELEAAGLHLPEGAGSVLTGFVLPARVVPVAAVAGVRSIELSSPERLELHESVPATHADQVRTGTLGLSGVGVVVGVVDSGIDIYHHAFRHANGKTRIIGLLDTTSPYRVTASGSPTGGTFQLAWTPPASGGAAATPQTTTSLPFSATVSQVLAALNALAAVDPGDVLATGGPLPGSPITVAFAGRYLHKGVEPLVVTGSVTPATAAIVIQRGREYTEQDINTALEAPGSPFGSFDADGHGTHVMGIAAGDGSQAGTTQTGGCHGSDYYVGVAPRADLVAVKTTLLDADTMRGVDYVFSKAGTKPAVVNLSLGGPSGAHDGSADDEQHYDQILTASPTGRAIVVSAGNSGEGYDHTRPAAEQSRSGNGIHAFKTVPPNGSVTMDVVVGPRDRDDDWFFFWYAGTGRLSLQLREPGGATLAAAVAPGAAVLTAPLANHPLWIRNRTNETTTNRHRISVRISPVAGGVVAAGTWRFTLTETAGQETPVDCWINDVTKDPHPRFTNADQDRTRTLTTPGTAHNVITVANYDHRDNTLHPTSSQGPTTDTRPAGATKPDLAAPGVGIVAARSFARDVGICCECCDDFYVAMTGTSMAAPHITGIVALLLQRNRTLTWEQVRAHLRTTCDPPDPITGPTLPNSSWGAGIVHAEKAAAGVPAHVRAEESPVLMPTFTPPGDAPPVPARVPRLGASAGDPGGRRLRELRQAVLASPLGQLAAVLVSTHYDEVQRLASTERRVTVAWHKMGGPRLVRLVLETPPGEPVALPDQLEGRPLGDGLARLLDALETAGSPRLRADVVRHRALLLSLPGRGLDDLTGLGEQVG